MVVALPELGLVAAALFLLLAAAALWVLVRLINGSLGKAPVIGGWITKYMSGWLNDARNALLNASSSTWHGLVQLFNWSNNLVAVFFTHLILFASETSSTLTRLAFVRLPEILGQAESHALSLVNSLKSEVTDDYNKAVSFATSVLHTAEQQAQSLANSAITEARTLFTRAEQDATALVKTAETSAANAIAAASTTLKADIASAEALAAHEVSILQASTQAAINQLAHDTTSGIQSAEALAAAQLAALQQGIITDLQTTGDTAVSLAWPDAIPDIQALRGTLGADFPWLNDLLGLMAGAGTAGLLGALIRSMATSQALTKLATDCIVPNCRNLSGLGGLLQELAGLLEGDIIFTLLAEAVSDPAGAARDINTALYQPSSDAVTLFTQLLGA